MVSLTEKQARFVEEYLIDFNASDAARRAGYSASTAGQIGFQLLKKTSIIDALNRRRAAIAKSTGITQERILQEYACIGFSDIRKAVRWKSNILATAVDPDTGEAAGVHVTDIELVDSEALDDDTALAISEIAKDARGGLKLKMYDKKAALDSLARVYGMFDGKRGAGPQDADNAELDIRQAARDLAFMLMRGMQQGVLDAASAKDAE